MANFADFKARYPELVTSGDANQPAIESYLAEVLTFVNLSVCPKRADIVQMAYAAHYIFKSGNSPAGAPDDGTGIATSKSVGSVSVSYQVAESRGQLSDWWKSSTYGNEYLMQVRMCMGSGIMTAP